MFNLIAVFLALGIVAGVLFFVVGIIVLVKILIDIICGRL